jgi:signal transduction histidine kinase/ActR/RegA family two-component response regulator
VKILCVDDKAESRRLLEIFLGAASYEVVSVSNGLDAVQKLESGGIDLIVSGVLSPPFDGFQLCDLVQSRPEFQDIPFVFYTEASTDPKSQELALSKGAARFLNKNIGPERFFAILREVTRESRAVKGAPVTWTPPEPDEAALQIFHSRIIEKLESKITESEDRANSLKEALEAKDREMTERIRLESELRLVQKMECVALLAGSVAHDFNNILTVILNHTEFVLQGLPEGSASKEDLLEIKKAGEKAVGLTRQLLIFSRKPLMSTVTMDLNHVVVELGKVIQRLLGKGVTYFQDLATDLGAVRADPGQVEQLIVNLVVNAYDAMPEGGKFTLQTSNVIIDAAYAAHHVDVKPGSYVRLTVTDTGCGMDEQTKARLFEPFFSTKGKGKGKGIGLGLSAVYGIVKQSGGHIRVHSEPGRGTTFKIYLPRAKASAAPVPAAPVGIAGFRGTETVLLVEDGEALRHVVQRALEMAGYTVVSVADGGEALLAAARHTGELQLLLTDIAIPKMNGRSIAQELRKTHPSLKVLYMSGYAENMIAQEDTFGAGEHFIGKPFTSGELARMVRAVLDGKAAGLAAGSPPVEWVGEGREGSVIDRSQVQVLPEEVRDNLRKAVAAAHYDEVGDIIEDIQDEAPDLAKDLRHMADSFDYEGILEFLGQRGKEEPHGI